MRRYNKNSSERHGTELYGALAAAGPKATGLAPFSSKVGRCSFKPVLKPPGSALESTLKRKHFLLLSNIAFNFYLRLYTKEGDGLKRSVDRFLLKLMRILAVAIAEREGAKKNIRALRKMEVVGDFLT